MKKIFKTFGGVMMALLMLASCNSNDDNYQKFSITYNSQNLIMGTMSVTQGSDLYTITTSPGVIIEQDLTNTTFAFTFSGLTIGSAGSIGTVTTTAIPYTLSQSATFSATATSLALGSVTMEDFRFYGYGNWMYISFTINGVKYMITPNVTYTYGGTASTAIPMVVYEGSCTVTGTPFDPNGFTYGDGWYALNFNTTDHTVNVYLLQAQFASSMPQLDIMIPDVHFSMTANGYVLNSDEPITPYNITADGNDPVPSYVINDFSATLPFNGNGGTMSFKCSDQNWSVGISQMSIAVLQ